MKFLLRSLLLFALSSFLFSEQYQVAVIDVTSIGEMKNKEILESAVSENLRTAFSSSGGFQVVERSYIEKILEEQKIQISGFTDSQEAIQVGKIAGVNYIVLGTICKIDNYYTLNIRMVSVENGMIEKAGTKTVKSQIDLVKVTAEMPSLLLETNNELQLIKTENKIKYKKEKTNKKKNEEKSFLFPDKIEFGTIDPLSFTWDLNRSIMGGQGEFGLGIATIFYREYFNIWRLDKMKMYYDLGLGGVFWEGPGGKIELGLNYEFENGIFLNTGVAGIAFYESGVPFIKFGRRY